jgi:hypothetical protein
MTSAPLSLVLGVYFLGITSFTALTALLALYFEAEFAIGAREMGFLFAIAGGVTVIVRGVVLGQLVKRFGEIATVRTGAVSLGLSFLLVTLAPSFGWAMVVVPFYAFGAGTMFPALATLTSLASDADSQGSILGGSQVVGGLPVPGGRDGHAVPRRHRADRAGGAPVGPHPALTPVARDGPGRSCLSPGRPLTSAPVPAVSRRDSAARIEQWNSQWASPSGLRSACWAGS